MTHHRQRVIVYVGLGILVTFVLLALEAQASDQDKTIAELHALVRSEREEDKVEDAVRCVTSWEVREDIRQSDAIHAQESAAALVEVLEPESQALVETYRVVLDQHLQLAQEVVEDPECDLAAAKAIITNQEKP